MNNVWFQSALWMALALVAATASLYITISAALFEIVVGAIAGNTIGLPLTDWINYVAGIGAVVLTFLAGTDIDPHVVKRNFASSVTIGLMGFFAPYLGCLLLAHYGLGWRWPQAQIGGRPVHHVGRGGLCRDGRNRLQPDRTGQDHPCRLLHQRHRDRAGARADLCQLQFLFAAVRDCNGGGDRNPSIHHPSIVCLARRPHQRT